MTKARFRLIPGTLAGRIMLVTAIGVLLVQGLNSAIRYQAFQARAVVEAASHLSTTVSNQLERLQNRRDAYSWRRRRVAIRIALTPVQPPGFASTDELAERVAASLQSIYPQVQSVRLSIGPIATLPAALRQERRVQNRGARAGRQRPSRALLLTMQMDDGRWVQASLPLRERNMPPIRYILFETLLIYLGVLIPLLLVIRQMSKPLRQLNQRMMTGGLVGSGAPLQPRGPDDIRELIESFNAAEARVDAMLTEKDVMLGAIGHDLKTPLASLRVRIESVDDDVERTKMAATIDETVHILDDILTLARLGKSAEERVLADVGALVATIVDEFDADDRLTVMEPQGKCRATVRPVLLRRALRNLIDNALKYGGRASITVDCASADQVTVTIDDDGPGIDPLRIAEMFEPFARAEASRNRSSGGSGLGLTIARAIARVHGGDVVLSNRGQGGLRAVLTIGID